MIIPTAAPEQIRAGEGAQVWLVETRRKPKAADIDTVGLLRLVDQIATARQSWALVWDIAPHYPAVPWRVINAKLAKMMRLGLVDGCPCGCRGDWRLVKAGYDLLDAEG